jgi:starch phosphorylase
MASLTPQFSANRSVREYTEEHYIPLVTAHFRRISDGNTMAEDMLSWKRQLSQHWYKLRFGPIRVETEQDQRAAPVIAAA